MYLLDFTIMYIRLYDLELPLPIHVLSYFIYLLDFTLMYIRLYDLELPLPIHIKFIDGDNYIYLICWKCIFIELLCLWVLSYHHLTLFSSVDYFVTKISIFCKYCIAYVRIVTHYIGIHEPIVKPSIKTIYRVYSLISIFNPNLTFGEFYKDVFFLIKLSGISIIRRRILFLYLLFFCKTLPTLRVVDIKHNFQISQQKSSFFIQLLNPAKSEAHLAYFWLLYKKWIRPEILEEDKDDSIFEFFTKRRVKRFGVYNKLKFIRICYLYPILSRSKLEIFFKDLVKVDQPLLISPKFSSFSMGKYINIYQVRNFELQFLRKNKVYNKGRYSRCRQNYRTGVYMCMYLSIVSIFGLYYWFFKFSFNFTYLWWLFISFIGSFFLPKIIKYRLYEPINLINKFFDFFRWAFLVIKPAFGSVWSFFLPKITKIIIKWRFIELYQFLKKISQPFFKKEYFAFVFWGCIIMSPFLELYGITNGHYNFCHALWLFDDEDDSFFI